MTASTTDFLPGGYRYMPGVFQYAGGVAALPGWRIERARFMTPVPLAAGFERIASVLQQAGRPLTAFCACELQSPAPTPARPWRHRTGRHFMPFATPCQ